jgi:RNA-directed DNA polymerase
MSLKDDEQQNIQLELDFSSGPTGEAREAGREGTESSGATNGPESPASTNRLMEEVCERENLKAALQQVRANKGSPGVAGMTVGGLADLSQFAGIPQANYLKLGEGRAKVFTTARAG